MYCHCKSNKIILVKGIALGSIIGFLRKIKKLVPEITSGISFLNTLINAFSDLLPHHLDICAVLQGSVAGDAAGLEELIQAVVHRDHILLRGGVDDAFDLVHLVVADHVADGRGHDHDFKRRGEL